MKRILLIACILLYASAAVAQDSFTPPVDPRNFPQDPNAAPFGVYDSLGDMSGFNFNDIRFFEGKRLDCMKALGGLLNCCKNPPPENQSKNYWDKMKETMAQSTNAQGKFDLTTLGDTGDGGWAAMLGGATPEDLMKSFSSSFEGLLGGGSGASSNQDPTMQRANQEYFAYANAEIKPRLGWYCDSDEFELAVGRQVGNCTNLGSFCQTRVLGFCVIKKDRYCCFNSPVTRIIREDLDRRNVSDLGTARHPRCEGITFEQMAQVSQDTTDTDEIVGRMYEGEFMPDLASMLGGDFGDMESLLDGAASMIGDPTRMNPSDRNTGRLEGTDPAGAYGSIESGMRNRKPVYDSNIGPHLNSVRLLVGQTSVQIRPGEGFRIPVARSGSSGTVRAQLDPITGTSASVGADYTINPSLIMWGPNQTQEQAFIVQVPHTATPGRVMRLDLSGEHIEGGDTRELVLDGETLIQIQIIDPL